MKRLDNFLKQQTIDPKPKRHELKLLKPYVCRSITQEGLGKVDPVVVERMLQGRSKAVQTVVHGDTLGFVKAYQYVHELSQCDDGGLLDNNVIVEVHRILMSHRSHQCTVGKYSEMERLAEFDGRLHIYPKPLNMEEAMQMLINEYNHRWFTVNRLRRLDSRRALEELIHLAAWLIYKFLELHPFGDGNGRTIRLLYTYIMESYGFPFPVSPMLYSKDDNEHFIWCRTVQNVQMTGNLEQLEQLMTHSLSTSCNEYDTTNKTS